MLLPKAGLCTRPSPRCCSSGPGFCSAGQGGFLDHKDTMDNIRLFGSEVMPRLRELETRRSTTAAAE